MVCLLEEAAQWFDYENKNGPSDLTNNRIEELYREIAEYKSPYELSNNSQLKLTGLNAEKDLWHLWQKDINLVRRVFKTAITNTCANRRAERLEKEIGKEVTPKGDASTDCEITSSSGQEDELELKSIYQKKIEDEKWYYQTLPHHIYEFCQKNPISYSSAEQISRTHMLGSIKKDGVLDSLSRSRVESLTAAIIAYRSEEELLAENEIDHLSKLIAKANDEIKNLEHQFYHDDQDNRRDFAKMDNEQYKLLLQTFHQRVDREVIKITSIRSNISVFQQRLQNALFAELTILETDKEEDYWAVKLPDDIKPKRVERLKKALSGYKMEICHKLERFLTDPQQTELEGEIFIPLKKLDIVPSEKEPEAWKEMTISKLYGDAHPILIAQIDNQVQAKPNVNSDKVKFFSCCSMLPNECDSKNSEMREYFNKRNKNIFNYCPNAQCENHKNIEPIVIDLYSQIKRSGCSNEPENWTHSATGHLE